MSVRTTFIPFPVPKADAPGSTPKEVKLEDLMTMINSQVGAGVVEKLESNHKGDPFLVIHSEHLHSVVKFLRDHEDCRYIYPLVIAATDFLASEDAEKKPIPGRVEVVYVLYSLKYKHQLTLKVILDRDNPVVRSVSDLYRAANWYERECFDMIGVNFLEHPHPKRILLPEDWVGHPLRKDYVFPQEYNGMKVPL